MSDIIDEINNDLSQERLINFVSKYWVHFLASVAILLFAIILSSKLNEAKNNKTKLMGELYNKSLNIDSENNSEELIKFLDQIIKEDKNGYKQLAILKEASYFLKDNKIDAAIKIFDQLGSSKNSDKALCYLSQLIAISVLIEANKYEDVDKRIEKIIVKDNPFYISSLFMKLNWLNINKKYKDMNLLINDIIMHESATAKMKETASLFNKMFKNYDKE